MKVLVVTRSGRELLKGGIELNDSVISLSNSCFCADVLNLNCDFKLICVINDVIWHEFL